uniref:Uncharacterized protein n=1 Tax=uncultured marine virus TaxID=186617 RepID=A0A0F7L0S8_9VIRU|nr:hypothetical protein [uncultured marine virus]
MFNRGRVAFRGINNRYHHPTRIFELLRVVNRKILVDNRDGRNKRRCKSWRRRCKSWRRH